MKYTFPAGTYGGIPVRIHFTFPLILVVFGAEARLRGSWGDALGAVVLGACVFACVVLHEFGHSIQVRRYGIQVRDIILLPIGGMARAERIPERPLHEFVVAIAGPVVNFAIATILFGVLQLRGESVWQNGGFLVQLLAVNLLLGTFNLIPAFPMDGGRILRAVLASRMPYLRATRVARATGQVIALLFVVAAFHDPTYFMLTVIAVFIFIGGAGEEAMIRVRHILGEKLARDVAVDLRDGNVSSLPAVSADMPAVQLYYTLKSNRIKRALVVDESGAVGVVDFDRLLDTPA